MAERCTVEGAVQSLIFQNEDNGYTVLSLLTEDGELVTVVGCIPCAAPGEGMTVTGVWTNHPSYGPQFAAESVERRMPRTEEEIVSYLSSGILKGMAPPRPSGWQTASGQTLWPLSRRSRSGFRPSRASPPGGPWSCLPPSGS